MLFTLPQSRPRLSQLARNYDILRLMGAEVIAVPTDGGEQIISRLGASPRILFPVATQGGQEILAAYSFFWPGTQAASPAHAEFLVDRQGFLRARWIPDGKGWTEITALLAEIQQLNQEVPATSPPDEHVH